MLLLLALLLLLLGLPQRAKEWLDGLIGRLPQPLRQPLLVALGHFTREEFGVGASQGCAVRATPKRWRRRSWQVCGTPAVQNVECILRSQAKAKTLGDDLSLLEA